ncbi:cation diffusion facilitator family transporter [Brevibacillus sp. MCWH]|uniref:cation diffusion facilitator family transporter n=1 Tax=Brevibacillus sp. MCWH TaxID=2508871 RepID=UPI0014912FB9|nr:cation diffusion facilitator family transporter [Brevibacillus sp. MCWH]NNV03525.1 cation transporter [Brevibacillus sp. MCWH]
MGLHHHHGHAHDHGHGHHHHHGKGASKRALLIAFLIITAFLVVEIVGGILTNSLALLSDAGHMVSDASALLLSLIALHVAARPPSTQKTFGLRRLEILAALTNGVTLAVISLAILWEAYERLRTPPEVASSTMILIASLGLVANIAAAYVLMRGDYRENVNVRSALLHVLGDLLGSVGAIIGGLLMLWFGWYIADPLISIVVAVLILFSSWRVTKESVNILMEGSPAHIDVTRVSERLLQLDGVKGVHDLHVWTVTSGFDSLTCHLTVEDDRPSYPILNEAIRLLHDEFGISHVTIQIEDDTVRHAELACEHREPAKCSHEHDHPHS